MRKARQYSAGGPRASARSRRSPRGTNRRGSPSACPTASIAQAPQQRTADPEPPAGAEGATEHHQHQLLPPCAHGASVAGTPDFNGHSTSPAQIARPALAPNANIGAPFSHSQPKTAEAGSSSKPDTRLYQPNAVPRARRERDRRRAPFGAFERGRHHAVAGERDHNQSALGSRRRSSHTPRKRQPARSTRVRPKRSDSADNGVDSNAATPENSAHIKRHARRARRRAHSRAAAGTCSTNCRA